MTTRIVLLSFCVLLFILSTLQSGGAIVIMPVELHSTREFPCMYHVRLEDIFAGQWFKSHRSDVFVDGGKAVAWRYEDEAGGSPGFSITEDFSLIAYNISRANEGVFRCIITPNGDAEDATFDMKLVVYAIPSNAPTIEYTSRSDGFQVKCSVNNVYPLAYPSLTANRGITNKVENEDGTYLTTITDLVQLSEENTIVNCFYSNINYNSSSSLRLYQVPVDYTADLDKFCSNFSCPDFNNSHISSAVWMAWTTIVLEVLCSINIIHAMKTRGIIPCNNHEETSKSRREDDDGADQDEIRQRLEQNKLAWKIVFGKQIFLGSTLLIQIIVITVMVVYLATSK